ncbi:MAG: CHAP domain-containing protein [Chloroflexi bacterium]|nr:CHAP domain-containing protein [Chloroflexota bacterium]
MATPMVASTAAAAAPPNHFTPGQCTWWAAHTRPDIGARVYGSAKFWTASAQAAGLATGTTPEPDAIVVFQPGVEGAWGAGHVAHVNDVSPDGVHFTVDEMDYPVAFRMTLRVAQTGPGVSFIYG